MESQPDMAFFDQAIKPWIDSNPGVAVSHANLDYDTFVNQALPTWAAAGTLPDVYETQGTYNGTWASRQWLAQLDDLVKRDAQQVNTADFWPSQVQSELQYKGHWVALPFDFGEVGAYFNRDLFRAVGLSDPPKDWTWDDVLDMAKKLTKTDNGQQVQGGIGGYPRTQEFQAYLWAYGGAFLSDDGTTCVVNDPKYADANAASLQYFADLGNKYRVIPSDPKSRNNAGFWASKVGIQLGGSWAVANFRTNINNHFSWDTQWWPVTKATGRRGIFASGGGYGMSPTTKKRDQAWSLLLTVSGTAADELIIANRLRGLPGRKSALPAWQKAAANGGDPSHATVFPDMLNSPIYPRQPVVFWDDLYNLADEVLGTIWSGKQQAHEALGDWQTRMNAAISKYKGVLG